jgi:hypothetical protein
LAIWLAATFVAIGCVFVIVVAIKSPFTQTRVAQGLEETLRSRVSFGKFRMVYFPHPGCVAENVTFARSAGAEDRPPLVSIQRLEVEAHYTDIAFRPGYIALVTLKGLEVHVPSRGAGSGLTSQTSESADVRVGKIVADGSLLEVERSDGGAPLKFEMHSLTVRSYGHHDAWSYDVSMKNAEPPGEITSEGKFGPLNLEDLGATPVSGSYKFQQADLGAFPGIGGTLSSTGDFAGRLGQVDVRGTIDIPDFNVTTSDHVVHLTSKFSANVNGTNGDVFLKQVQASFLETSVAGSGSVAGKPGQKGKTTSLDLEVDQGRIQDLLQLFLKAKHGPLNGVASFKTHVVIPPQGRPFLNEVTLRGDFGIGQAAFTKPSRQAQIDDLSSRASGEKKAKDKEKTKTTPQPTADDSENVVLNLQGHLEVRDGIAKFSELSFSVPGASARMNGTYNLVNEQIDFHGTLKTEAELSQETTGIKSALLKPFDPLFKRKKAGAVIPVKMTGTYRNPEFGFDVTGAAKTK